MKRVIVVIALIATAWALPERATAQPAGRPARPARGEVRNSAPLATPPPAPEVAQSADQLRDELSRILDQYPPSVRQVLRLDPSISNNADYVTLYPALGSFVERHPEVLHNPGFYFGAGGQFPDPWSPTPRSQGIEAVRNILEGLTVLTGLIAFMSLIGWGLKTFVEHRRWLRASKVQTEAHAKLLDRLTSNTDLLAYIQTPAGRQFLEASPVPTSTVRPAVSAPVNRILWSVQAGVVLALLGAGLWYSHQGMIDDIAQPLRVLGVLSMFLGAGFVISALVAYALSRLLGLLDAPALQPNA